MSTSRSALPDVPGPADVSAAVIAGGRNSRMGSPKGQLPVHGVPMLTRIVDVLRSVSSDVLCVTCRPEEYAFEAERVRMVPDYGGVPQGPLSGIMGALEHARHELCIVVAVDMPRLNGELLRYLTRLSDGSDVVLPVIEGDRLECLHAVYRKTCLPHGVAALKSGLRKVTVLFPHVTVRRVDRMALQRYDPDLASFQNINTPHEHSRLVRATPPSAGEAGHGAT